MSPRQSLYPFFVILWGGAITGLAMERWDIATAIGMVAVFFTWAFWLLTRGGMIR